MLKLLNTVCAYAYFYLRPLIKWFLHKTTKLCEIQRICYGTDSSAQRSIAFEYSLRQSRCKPTQKFVEHLDELCLNRRLKGETGNTFVEAVAAGIIRTKKINVNVHKGLFYPLTICLAQVFGYKQLVQEIEKVREIPFSSNNAAHEEKLLKLWEALMPDCPLDGRISKQWGLIGFQGDDPKTDFRGMGLLGLENLLYFATNYNGPARHVLSHSQHPQYGYSFAIVGINLTSMAYEFLVKDTLRTHMYNVIQGRPSICHFHKVYVYLFYEFDQFWLNEKPKDIMEFNRIRDLFYQKITKTLKDPKGLLRLNFAVETV